MLIYYKVLPKRKKKKEKRKENKEKQHMEQWAD